MNTEKSTQKDIDQSDYETLDKMTEAEIQANAEADPDNPPATDEQLKAFKRVHPKTEH